MEAFVYRFGGLWCHGAHGEALGGDVVSDDGCRSGLDVYQLLQCGAQKGCKLASHIERGKFGLGGRGNGMFGIV